MKSIITLIILLFMYQVFSQRISQVTLKVFSGRPNPAWTLTKEEERRFIDLCASRSQKALPEYQVLGYTGFSVLIGLDNRPLLKYKIYGNEEIELFLLKTGEKHIQKDITEYVLHNIFEISRKNLPTKTISAVMEERMIIYGELPIRGPDNGTMFNPDKWNSDPRVQYRNNCYNYACNVRTDTFAQPGLGTGKQYNNLTCEEVFKGSYRDRLIPLYRNGELVKETPVDFPRSGQFVALYVWPNYDFHWYRKDKNKMWSHKPGATRAIDTDNSGKKIHDPHTADRAGYKDFCGFYIALPSAVEIE